MEGFRQYQDAAGTRVLKANTNTFQTVEHILTKVVIASKLRFVNVKNHLLPNQRIKVYQRTSFVCFPFSGGLV
jgi:hypothetical protein